MNYLIVHENIDLVRQHFTDLRDLENYLRLNRLRPQTFQSEKERFQYLETINKEKFGIPYPYIDRLDTDHPEPTFLYKVRSALKILFS